MMDAREKVEGHDQLQRLSEEGAAVWPGDVAPSFPALEPELDEGDVASVDPFGGVGEVAEFGEGGVLVALPSASAEKFGGEDESGSADKFFRSSSVILKASMASVFR